MVQELFRTVHRNGYFVPKTTMSAISPSTGRTLPDRYIEGTCPICGYDGARGDQCDNCGNQLDPIDLINPHSRINGETPKFVESEHFFLDLPALAGALGAWLQTRTDWRPNVLRFSLNLLDDLRPRAMTRDIDWGIPVPLDGWRDRPDKKLYVWFDAVIGYLSASIEWARRLRRGRQARSRGLAALVAGRPGPVSTTSWARTTSPSTRRSGRPSCWPTTAEGERGGSPGTLGALEPADRGGVQRIPDDERVEVLHLAQDGHLRRRFPARVRPGRVAVLHRRRRAGEPGRRLHLGRVRAAHQLRAGQRVGQPGQPVDLDGAQELRPDPGSRPRGPTWTSNCSGPSEQAFDTVGDLLARSRFKAASGEAMRVAGLANKYISESEPWKLGGDPERQATVLHTALQVVDDAKTLLTPFLPHSSQQVFEALGGQGVWAAQPEIREVTDFDDDVEGVGVPGCGRLPGDHRRLRRRAGDLAAPRTSRSAGR